MKKFISSVLALVMLISALCINVSAVDTVDDNPDSLEIISIDSYSELTEKLSSTAAKYYKLTADIDFVGITSPALTLYEGSVFNANGYSFLNINAPSISGIFTIAKNADTDKATVFKNLTVGTSASPAVVGQAVMLYNHQGLTVSFENVDIFVSTAAENSNNHSAFCSGTTSGNFTFTNCSATITVSDKSVNYGAAFGAFISRNKATVLFENCIANGDIIAVNNAGGFIGKNDAGKTITFKNCTNNANITSGQFTGGFVGVIEQKNNILKFTNCQNKATVTNTSASNTYSAGGFVGGENKFNLNGVSTAPNSSISISYSYNDADVVLSDASCAGGFVGKAWGSVNIDNCVNYGNIGSAGGNKVAGFIVGDNATKTINITNSLNIGTITSKTWATGFCTQSSDVNISNCINVGDIIGDIWEKDGEANGYAGGFFGGGTVNTLSDCYSFGRVIDNNDSTIISYNLMGQTSATLSAAQQKYTNNYCCSGGKYKDADVPNVDGTATVAYATSLQVSLVAVKYLNNSIFGCLNFSYSSADKKIVCNRSQGVSAVGWQMHVSGKALRVIGTVDSLDYDAIGFKYKVKVNGSPILSGDYTCSTVYSCIQAGTSELRPIHFGGRYIYLLTFNNVELNDEIEITAFSKKGGVTTSSNTINIKVTNTDPILNQRDSWAMTGFPAYIGGSLSDVYFQTVGYKTLISNKANYSMQYATATTAAEFNKYINILQNEYKFDVDVNSSTDNMISFWVTNNKGARMYAYFTASTGEARFILDKESQTRTEFSDNYQKQDGDTASVYLYGIAMDPDGENNTTLADHKDEDYNNFYGSNCGMLMILKLYDNSVIIIDGGGYAQMSEQAAQKLDTFLHDITDTPQGDKVRIRTWFLTHPHGDHYTGFIRFIVNYHQNYELESVMYNLKNCPDDLKSLLGNYLPVYYPDITYHRPHTGESLTLGGVKLDVMFTFEDLIASDTLKFSSTDDNDTSAVVKVTIDGKTILITADIFTSASSVLLRNYDNGELKSDVMQVPHHGLNPLFDFFEEVSPSKVLFTQSKMGAQKALGNTTLGIYNALKTITGGDANMYYADGYYNSSGVAVDTVNSGTTEVTVENGQLKITVYPEYSDHTPYPTDTNSQWESFDDFNGNEVTPK